MDHQFRLPGGNSFLVHGWGNLPVELLAAIAGVKPVTHCWVDEGDQDYLSRLCRAFGLEQLVLTRDKGQGLSLHKGGAARLEVMIGRDASLLRKAADIWHLPGANPGVLLGYPECCVDSYYQWHQRYPSCDLPDYVDVIHNSYRKTSRRSRLPFLLNDVFYLYSRRWGTQGLPQREQLLQRNPGLDMDVMNVIPWHPCSYECEESLRKAQAVWELMRRMAPALAAMLRTCLTRPVLFWDWTRFAVLKGRIEGEEAVYDGVQPPFSLLEPERLAAVRAGRRVSVREEGGIELRDGSPDARPWGGDAPILLAFSE